VLDIRADGQSTYYVEPEEINMVADPVVQYMTKDELERTIQNTKRKMQVAAKDLEFMEAARLRDEMFALEKLYKEKFE